MKALSLTPPWPGAILHLGKRIENRERWRGCSYRGPILLHAAKGIGTRDDFDETAEGILDIVDPTPESAQRVRAIVSLGITTRADKDCTRWAPTERMLRGGICGRARIVDVIDPATTRPGPPPSTSSSQSAAPCADRRCGRRCWSTGARG